MLRRLPRAKTFASRCVHIRASLALDRMLYTTNSFVDFMRCYSGDANTDVVDNGLSVTKIRNHSGQWVDAHQTFVQGGVHATTNNPGIDGQKSWEEVDWDEIRENLAKSSLDTEQDILPEDVRSDLEDQNAVMWEDFYTRNQTNAYKHRRYLTTVYPVVAGEGTITTDDGSMPVIMEVGCGVGNTLFPLLEANPDKYFHAFDCSSTAVDLVINNEEYVKERCNAFVLDITREDIAPHIAENSVDVAFMIFVLSAVPPNLHEEVLAKVKRVLKPGGTLFIRDYGLYDLAQMRFFAKKNSKIGDNYYKRGDGTLSHFFSKEAIEAIGVNAGFDAVDMDYTTRLLVNRKRMLKMYRVWVCAEFVKPIVD
eukprot:TRINITY_DN3725_c0_g1_i1.p1 TRINITY_DN3725_c0_g1~~TRINITY_DN3725_c0_g1_i1.p1  ORF type:complete len:366 (-),score=94.33 TRINITY_DN3725_c0_g1_i1:87-1184(-)